MIPTISTKGYGDLLLRYQPKVIKTEAENEAFLLAVEELMSRSQLLPEEAVLLELLVKLIEDFEAQHYALNLSTPRSRLLHLMEQRGLVASDLDQVLANRGTAIADGKAEIGLEQAIALGQFFAVKPELFLVK